MPLQDGLGCTAAVLTTGSFLPQAPLTLRTRDVSGISLGMCAAMTLGVAPWLACGLVLRQWPIVVANGVTLVLASTILVAKRVVERRGRRALLARMFRQGDARSALCRDAWPCDARRPRPRGLGDEQRAARRAAQGC